MRNLEAQSELEFSTITLFNQMNDGSYESTEIVDMGVIGKQASQEAVLVPFDRGPRYSETDMGQFPVEPCNTYSNLIFVLVILIWYRKLQKEPHRFLRFSIFVLLLGTIGGTIYHATRSHQLWLFLDYAPLGALVVLSTGYLWYDLFRRRRDRFAKAAFAVTLLVAVVLVVTNSVSQSLNASYLQLVSCIAGTSVAHCLANDSVAWRRLALAMGLFTVALSFRWYDKSSDIAWLPMGTHFLWHIFGGISVCVAFGYVHAATVDTIVED